MQNKDQEVRNKIIIELDADDYEKRKEAKLMLDAVSMKTAIESYYNDVLRVYYKHKDLTDDQYKLLEEIREGLHEHFFDFFDD
jgi:hypothetical protein